MPSDSELKIQELRDKVTALSRIILKAQQYAESDPEVALTQARKSAEAICRSVFAAEVGEPGTIMLDELIRKLNERKLLPGKIVVPRYSLGILCPAAVTPAGPKATQGRADLRRAEGLG